MAAYVLVALNPATGEIRELNSSGDSLVINPATLTVPNSIEWIKDAQLGVAELVLKCRVFDSPSYFSITNGTSNPNEFAPVFEGVIEPGFASTPLSFFGTKGSGATPGNPGILFFVRYNSGTTLIPVMVDIPDAGIAFEFRNRATSMVYIYGSGSLLLVKTGAGLGYGTGAGGTVTQATSKSTGVTLNKAAGRITLHNAALAGDTTVSFTLTNSAIAAADVLVLNHISGGTPGSYVLNAQCGAGSAVINVRNVTTGSLSEAIVLQFALVKGAIA